MNFFSGVRDSLVLSNCANTMKFHSPAIGVGEVLGRIDVTATVVCGLGGGDDVPEVGGTSKQNIHGFRWNLHPNCDGYGVTLFSRLSQEIFFCPILAVF